MWETHEQRLAKKSIIIYGIRKKEANIEKVVAWDIQGH